VSREAAGLERLAGRTPFGRLIAPRSAELLLQCAPRPVVNGAVVHANLGQLEH
jgi:hypothetical protein